MYELCALLWGMYDICMVMCANNKNVWQSWVEIERYSVTYFNRITVFEAL